jgi:O-antigen/teichoic acid export membrane protein
VTQGEERKTARELIAGGGRHIAAALAGLLIYPLIARALSAELLGAWALLSTAGFLLALSDLGLTTAVQRAAVTEDHARARRAVALALVVVSAVAPTFAALSYFFLIDVPGLASAVGPSARAAAAVVLVAGAVSALAYPYRGFVLARGGVAAIATARAASSIVQLLVTLGAVFIERSLLAPAAGYLAGSLADLALTRRAARAIDPAVTAMPRLTAAWQETVAALRDGAAALVINIAVSVAVRVDVFVLSRVAPLAAVASYGVAGRAVDVSYLLAKQSTVALMPRLGDPSRRETAVRVGLGLFAGVIAAGMIALALAGQPLLVAWVGPVAEGPLTARVLALLAAAAIFQSATDVPASMLTLSGRTAWASAVPIAIGGAANISISIAGAPYYGIWAVAGSTIIGNAITSVLVWWRATKTLNWGAGAVARAFLPPCASGAAAAAVAWPLAGYASRGALESLLVCSAALVAAGVTLMGIMTRSGSRESPAITGADS